MTLIFRLIALALTVGFTTLLRAQAPASRTEIESRPKSPVSGQVVDASTGEPISGARVELTWFVDRCTPSIVGGEPISGCARGTAYFPRFDPVITGADGTFSFPAVPSGRVSVRARLKGYFEAAQWHPKPNTLSGIFDVGRNSTGIQLRLFRTARVQGVIVDEFGHPCAGWEVEYHSILLSQGRYYIENPAHSVATASDGTFSFDAGGDFYLTTSLHTAAPDSTGHPQAYPPSRWPTTDTPLTDASFSSLPDTGHDLPPTRHADFGVNIPVKMLVTPKPLHHVTGTASTTESSSAALVTTYAEPRFGMPLPLNTGSTNGRIDLWLPDGEYVLEAVSPTAWARVPLIVAGEDVAGIRIQTHPNVSVPIQVTGPGATDSAGAPTNVPFGFGLAFMEERPAGVVNVGGVTHAHAKGDEFLVEYLLPGNYIVTTWGFPSWYVSSITAGGVDLNGHPYVVSETGTVTPISVVLRKDVGALSGVVRKDGKPVDAYVYAIPIFPTTAAPPQTFSRRDGTYHLDQIPPGSYRMIALEYQELVPYREPNALKPWLLRGRPINVGSNSVDVVDLEVEHQ